VGEVEWSTVPDGGEGGTVTRQERSRRARAKWRRLICAQGRSAQSVASFCRERRLCVPHFYWWKKRLRAEAWPASTRNGGEAAKRGGAGRFVEVQLARHGGLAANGSEVVDRAPEPHGSDDARVEIRLRNGRSLVVGRGCDAEQVRVLVGVVEAA